MTQNNVGIYASQISGHLYSGPYGSYDSLASVTVPSGGLTSVTFAGIPSGYRHLQIRSLFQCATGGEQLMLRFNSDASSSNYTLHQLVGDGSSASAAGFATGSIAGARTGILNIVTTASYFGGGYVDILDYANTNKYKTVRSSGGSDANGSGQIVLRSALWLNTSAISSIECRASDGSTMREYSQFALYGIK